MATIYRRKPLEVVAIQFTATTVLHCSEFAGANLHIATIDLQESLNAPLMLDTAKGTVPVRRNDWIIRTHEGDFKVCDDETFHQKYELA